MVMQNDNLNIGYIKNYFLYYPLNEGVKIGQFTGYVVYYPAKFPTIITDVPIYAANKISVNGNFTDPGLGQITKYGHIISKTQPIPRYFVNDEFNTNDFTNNWVFTGDRNWLYLTGGKGKSGSACISSGYLANNQSSHAELTVVGPLTITLWCMPSAYPDLDLSYVYLDGVAQSGFPVSGNPGIYTQKTITVPSGQHTIKMSFSRTAASNVGDDCLYVDDMTISVPLYDQITDYGTAQGNETFTSDFSGVLPSTTYYVRSYAVNAAGVVYGSVQTIMTSSASTYPAKIYGISPAGIAVGGTLKSSTQIGKLCDGSKLI